MYLCICIPLCKKQDRIKANYIDVLINEREQWKKEKSIYQNEIERLRAELLQVQQAYTHAMSL